MRTVLSDCVNEVTAAAVELRKQRRDLREGQSLMIALQEWSPHLYSDVCGSGADPSYLDELIPTFWMFVGERLQAYAEREARDGGEAETV